jgi:hypothetical protein
MKLPDEVRRDLVRQWIGKAEQDLGAAEILLTNALRNPIMPITQSDLTPMSGEK